MKRQLPNRLALPDVVNTLEQFVLGQMAALDAAASLGISRSRLYQLKTGYLRARAEGRLAFWAPGRSGGDHLPDWPGAVQDLLRRALAAGCTCAFAASEALRLFGWRVDRPQVRHWALAKGLAKPPRNPRPPAHLRRWQRENIGELWQLDEQADPWFGPGHPALSVFDMLDDCSRVQVGCMMFPRETLRAYLLLRTCFERYGLPLKIYVDRASFFRADQPGAHIQLERRRLFYGVSFMLANSPKAKGKVERVHQVWQDRLEPYFRLNGIGADADLTRINEHLDALRLHRNAHEKHREIGCTPDAAWQKAQGEGRSKLRPIPQDPWWPYVWSDRLWVAVGPCGVVRWNGWDLPTQYRTWRTRRGFRPSGRDGFGPAPRTGKRCISRCPLLQSPSKRLTPPHPPTVQFC